MDERTERPTGTWAEIGGLRLYHEDHGEGPPLVLLHGGMLTIDHCFGSLLGPLALHHRVIAVELQGHGRTPDIERQPTLPALAGDVAALLDHLGLERADVLGFSLGGLVAVQLAVDHPARVDRLILASAHVRSDGYHDEILHPDVHPDSTRMPTETDFAAMQAAFEAVAAMPGQFDALLEKLQPIVHAFRGWTDDQLRAIGRPTLVLVGDHDFVRLEHAVEMAHLLGDAKLGVLPDTTHMQVMQRTELVLGMVLPFLQR